MHMSDLTLYLIQFSIICWSSMQILHVCKDKPYIPLIFMYEKIMLFQQEKKLQLQFKYPH